ncbi:MAG: hypothetical protein AB8G77_01545, partial [Rhodothermales bacterium]
GRNAARVQHMVDALYATPSIREWGVEISIAGNLEALVSQYNLIVTTTSNLQNAFRVLFAHICVPFCARCAASNTKSALS